MKHKNHVSLIGAVGKDAEVRVTPGGLPYARFTLATSTGGYKKQDGSEVPEVTQWHSIVCWRSLADFAGKYIKKGTKLDVEGSIVYNQYTDKSGVQRLSVEIAASDFVLMSRPADAQQQTTVQQPVQQQAEAPQAGEQNFMAAPPDIPLIF